MKRLIFLFFPLFALQLYAQDTPALADTSRLWRIATVDGNEYFGHILDRNGTEIQLQTTMLGLITIPVQNIKSIKEIKQELIVSGELWTENPQSTRYLWGPNGYGLKQGEGYYQNIWVFFNQVSIGLSDNASVGLGIVPTFLFAGAPTPVWITPKVSIPVVEEQFNVGAGALVGTVLGLGEGAGGFFGIAYGVATIGGRNKNANLGLGYGFADGEWARRPTVSLSGMLRTGKKGYILTENYFIDAGGATLALISLGGRRVWGNVAMDFGGILPASNDVDTTVVIPWLGISASFGR